MSLDLFENQLYWTSRETGELFKQDKFGRGVPVVIAKDLVNPFGVKGEITWLKMYFLSTHQSFYLLQLIISRDTTLPYTMRANSQDVPISVYWYLEECTVHVQTSRTSNKVLVKRFATQVINMLFS